MSRRKNWRSDPTPQPALRVDATDVVGLLRGILKTLSSEREVGVMAMRWGLNDGEPKTLDEIGRVYGVTRERIRQIEMKATSKLTQALRDSALAVKDGDAVVDVVGLRRASAVSTEALVWCAHCHERPFDPRSRVPKGGRPRKYCSPKCRQAAYRARHRPAD